MLSYKAFRITLVPPDQEAITAFGEIAGNLHEDWEPQMSKGSARSSLIHYGMLADGTATIGTDANAWVLASGMPLNVGSESFYRNDEDNSTPDNMMADRYPLNSHTSDSHATGPPAQS